MRRHMVVGAAVDIRSAEGAYRRSVREVTNVPGYVSECLGIVARLGVEQLDLRIEQIVLQALILAFVALWLIRGTAMNARALRMSTTTNSSTNVKPFLTLMFFSFS